MLFKLPTVREFQSPHSYFQRLAVFSEIPCRHLRHSSGGWPCRRDADLGSCVCRAPRLRYGEQREHITSPSLNLLQLQIIKPGVAGDLLAFEAEAEAGGDGGFRFCGGEFERHLFPVGRGRNHFAGFGAIE